MKLLINKGVAKARSLILLLASLALISVTSIAADFEMEQVFPPDLKKFISDREGCDHFRSEPRDFDVSYKKNVGKKAEIEEAERAAFLQEMTEKACYHMDERLKRLNLKYKNNGAVIHKLSQYDYLDVGSGYVHIHKNFPNAKLIEGKLVAKGFMPSNIKLMKGVDRHDLNWDQPLPAKLTIQIGSMVDVFSAQLAIETLLEYGAKDIGVVLLPKGDEGLGLTMFVGINPIGNFHVYSGDSIQELLAPDLTQEEFEKFAKVIEPTR